MGLYEDFYEAIRVGDIEKVKLLFIRNRNYNTEAQMAAEYGHEGILKFITSNSVCNYNSIMPYASKGGHIHIIRLLVSLGANNYNTAMPYAAGHNHPDIVKFLVEKGATEFQGSIELASFVGNIEMLEFLLNASKEKGIQINIDKAISRSIYPEVSDFLKTIKQGKIKL